MREHPCIADPPAISLLHRGPADGHAVLNCPNSNLSTRSQAAANPGLCVAMIDVSPYPQFISLYTACSQSPVV